MRGIEAGSSRLGKRILCLHFPDCWCSLTGLSQAARRGRTARRSPRPHRTPLSQAAPHRTPLSQAARRGRTPLPQLPRSPSCVRRLRSTHQLGEETRILEDLSGEKCDSESPQPPPLSYASQRERGFFLRGGCSQLIELWFPATELLQRERERVQLELKDVLYHVPEIVELVGNVEADQLLHVNEQDGDAKVKAVLRSIFTQLMSANKEAVSEKISKMKSRLSKEKKVR